jgi:hypothetical protein
MLISLSTDMLRWLRLALPTKKKTLRSNAPQGFQ